MKIGKAKYKWFKEGDVRLDSSFHLSDARVYRKLLEKSPLGNNKLSDITENIYNGARFKRYYVDKKELGVPFMGSSDMLKTDLNGLKQISKKLSKNISALKIKKDWILVSCSGTIGNTAYTNSDFENKTASQHIMRIIPNTKVLSGYLYAFLSSKIGYSLLTQGTYGAVIQHIEPHHIEDLPIPVISEDTQIETHRFIIEASKLRTEANQSLDEAITLFEEAIDQSKVHLGFQTGTISSKSLGSFHKRLDSQYQLLWKSLNNEKKSNLQYNKLHTYADSIFVGGRGKRIYVENGIPFLSSSDMMLYNPKRGCKKVSKNTTGIASMTVSEKDILISRSGTVGNTVLVGKYLANTAISEHALRLVINPAKISPNYVFCFLKTKYGLKTMEASSFGSVIITLNEELIGDIELPILSDSKQKVINAKIEHYLECMDESTIKENLAIDLVEKEIESWQK